MRASRPLNSTPMWTVLTFAWSTSKRTHAHIRAGSAVLPRIGWDSVPPLGSRCSPVAYMLHSQQNTYLYLRIHDYYIPSTARQS